MNTKELLGRNPYFIGINSAIELSPYEFINLCSRNPYFIGINSAINMEIKINYLGVWSQSLFYWN